MNKKIKLLALMLIFSLPYFVNAQGCSDAGFCTISSFRPNGILPIKENSNLLKLGLSAGSADHSIQVFSTYLEYNKQFNSKLNLSGKLTGSTQSGNGISSSGLSDFFLTANYALNTKTKLVIGTKIPLKNANQKKFGKALPMAYQSSLGTFDLILGLGHHFNKVQVVLALQQPLSQNSNEFLSEASSQFKDFQSTRRFKRSGDLLLRVSYPIELCEKLRLTPSVLPIYHLKNDTFTGQDNIEREINDSKGLTFNTNAYLDYELNAKSTLQLSIGMPLVVRDSRPDGLTRSFIGQLEYRITF